MEPPAQRQRGNPAVMPRARFVFSARANTPSETRLSLSISTPIQPRITTYRKPITTSIWPLDWSSRNSPAPTKEPSSPPAIITPPIFRSTPPRRMWTIAPETLAPVI